MEVMLCKSTHDPLWARFELDQSLQRFSSTNVSKVKGLIKAILGELICLYVIMKLKYGLLLKNYQGYLFESQL